MATAQSLEETLGEVERLRRDLSAEIVVQEEKIEHISYEIPGQQPKGYSGIGDDNYYIPDSWDEYVVKIPRIAHPDLGKQDAATRRLWNLYDSCEFYSARYMAGKALGIKDRKLNSQINKYLRELERMIYLPINERVGAEHQVYVNPFAGDGDGHPAWCGGLTETVITYEERPIPENIELIKKAREDLIKLFLISRNVNVKRVLKDSGNLSGLPWEDRHPIASGAIGCGCLTVIIGALSGLGYMVYPYIYKGLHDMLYQYLTR